MYFVAIKMIKIAGKTVIMKGKTVHVLFMCLFEHMYIFVSMTAIKNAVMSKKCMHQEVYQHFEAFFRSFRGHFKVIW